MSSTVAKLLFISYAPADQAYVDKLETHLALLRHQGLIETWHTGRIFAGENRLEVTGARLQAADVILLLISPDFIASEACWSTEMKEALERHRAGAARVIPVLLRPCDWKSAPFGGLAVLPKNGRPVSNWSDRDGAFLDITQGIRELPVLTPSGASGPLTSPPTKATAGPSTQDQSGLKVFLNHIHEDKPQVRQYCDRLTADGFTPWLDERELLPGQRWRPAITRAVRASDAVIVFLSRQSMRKAGFGQKEIKLALDVLDEQPEDEIFLIPARLEDCDVPDRLRAQQYVDLFAPGGYDLLKRSLLARAQSLGL